MKGQRNIARLDDHRPHAQGPAVCLACSHRWRAVVPAGFEDPIECPACHEMSGLWSIDTSEPEQSP